MYNILRISIWKNTVIWAFWRSNWRKSHRSHAQWYDTMRFDSITQRNQSPTGQLVAVCRQLGEAGELAYGWRDGPWYNTQPAQDKGSHNWLEYSNDKALSLNSPQRLFSWRSNLVRLMSWPNVEGSAPATNKTRTLTKESKQNRWERNYWARKAYILYIIYVALSFHLTAQLIIIEKQLSQMRELAYALRDRACKVHTTCTHHLTRHPHGAA